MRIDQNNQIVCEPCILNIGVLAVACDFLCPVPHSQYPDAAASVLEGLSEMFTLNELGINAELARTMVTTNLIECPNSVGARITRRVSR